MGRRLNRGAALYVIVAACVTGLLPGSSSATGIEEAAPAGAGVTRKATPRQLAAGVLFACADSGATGIQRELSRLGVGGIVLLGSGPPGDLRSRLRSVARAAPGRPPVIASDEEGGTVQRLAPLLGPLPGAETMGQWPRRTLISTARAYARGMRDLGVGMSLAPVADLRVPGSYIDQLDRAFSSSPRAAGRDVIAWAKGTRRAGVIPVVKHWPGHGHARDTHTAAARIPRFGRLRGADLVPFDMALHHGVDAVMVGHLRSKGLTPHGVPASQSRRAISVLRDRTGAGTVIMTDSLSMAAATTARGFNESRAVIAALRAGVDWAMVCSADTAAIIRDVTRAIKDETLRRGALQRSMQRIRALVR